MHGRKNTKYIFPLQLTVYVSHHALSISMQSSMQQCELTTLSGNDVFIR